MRIDRFIGEYFFLSNFWKETVYFKHFYPSAEHAFQCSKATSHEDFVYVRSADEPKDAKKRGHEITLRPDWDYIKLQVMEDVVRAKFQNDDLRAKLRQTGTSVLIEGNTWGDRFWGIHMPVGSGENHLGRILMKIRWELR